MTHPIEPLQNSALLRLRWWVGGQRRGGESHDGAGAADGRRSQGEPGAAGYFRQQAEVAAGHAALVAAHLEGDPAQDFFLCQVCGYIAPQAAPERCPVCGAVHAKFTAVAA